MKKIFKSKLLIQMVVASMVATLATAGMVGAATTIGTNIETAGTLAAGATTLTGTLAVTGVTTLTGNLILSTASSTGLVKVHTLQLGPTEITATGAELNYVSGVTSAIQTQLNTKSPLANPTFTGTVTLASLTASGDLAFATASSTGTVKFGTINSDTGAISFGSENLSTAGTLASGAATITGALAATTLTDGTATLTSGAISGLTNLTASGNLAFATASSTGTISVATIDSTTGAISFSDENLSTTGTLSAGAATFSATGSFAGALNVNGYATTTAQGIISPGRFGVEPVTCGATLTGGLIWGAATKTLCVCDGSAWIAATSTNGTACGY